MASILRSLTLYLCVSLPLSFPPSLLPSVPTHIRGRGAKPLTFPSTGEKEEELPLIFTSRGRAWLPSLTYPCWSHHNPFLVSFGNETKISFGCPLCPEEWVKWGPVTGKEFTQTAPLAPSCSSDTTGRSGSIRGTLDTAGQSSGGSKGHEWASQTFCRLILLSSSPSFFPLSSLPSALNCCFPLCFPLKLGHLLPGTLLTIGCQPRPPQGCYPSPSSWGS